MPSSSSSSSSSSSRLPPAPAPRPAVLPPGDPEAPSSARRFVQAELHDGMYGGGVADVDVRRVQRDPAAFYREHVGEARPAVMRGGAAAWLDATALRRWQRPEGFAAAAGGAAREVTVDRTPDGRADCVRGGWFASASQRREPLGALLHELHTGGRSGDVPYVQLQDSNLHREFAPLLRDVGEDVPWMTAALGEGPEALNVWVGDQRSCSSWHKGSPIVMDTWTVDKRSPSSTLVVTGSLCGHTDASGSLQMIFDYGNVGDITSYDAQGVMYSNNAGSRTYPAVAVIRGHATTGPQPLTFSYVSFAGSVQRPFATYNPASTTYNGYTQCTSTYTVWELEETQTPRGPRPTVFEDSTPVATGTTAAGGLMTMFSFSLTKSLSTSELFIFGAISGKNDASGSLQQRWKWGSDTAYGQSVMYDASDHGRVYSTAAHIATATTGTANLDFQYYSLSGGAGEQPFTSTNPGSGADTRLRQTASVFLVWEIEPSKGPFRFTSRVGDTRIAPGAVADVTLESFTVDKIEEDTALLVLGSICARGSGDSMQQQWTYAGTTVDAQGTFVDDTVHSMTVPTVASINFAGTGPQTMAFSYTRSAATGTPMTAYNPIGTDDARLATPCPSVYGVFEARRVTVITT